jgi:class 3 adenylate cyclase
LATALPDHAAVCAHAILEMLENLRSLARRYPIDWAVRIRMNSGPLIGGIGPKNSLTTFGARP